MVCLQYGFLIAATQPPIAILLVQFLKLVVGKVASTGSLCCPSLTAIGGLGHPDLFRVALGPFLAARDHLFPVALVMVALGSDYALAVVSCPLLLVFGYSFSVFFLVLSTRFDL